jgi:hypothetical protein
MTAYSAAWIRAAVMVVGMLAPARVAEALVARIYPLAQVIEGSDWIASGAANPVGATPGRFAVRGKVSKGKVASSLLLIDAAGPAGKPLRERVRPGQRVVLFGNEGRGGLLFGFTEGTWFRAKRAGSAWSVTSMHPDMTRTWNGTSMALEKVVGDVLAGRAGAPAPDPKAKPALGPVVKK